MGFVGEQHFVRPVATTETNPFTVVFDELGSGDTCTIVSALRTDYTTGTASKDIVTNVSVPFAYGAYKAVTVSNTFLPAGDAAAVGIYRVCIIVKRADETKRQERNVIAHII